MNKGYPSSEYASTFTINLLHCDQTISAKGYLCAKKLKNGYTSWDSQLCNALLSEVVLALRRSGIDILPFREDQLVLIVHPEHPLAKHRRVEIRKLAGQRFVAFEKDIPTRRAVDRVLRRQGVAVDIVMEFDNVETIKRAVEINAGLAIVPALTVEAEVRNGTLLAIDFPRGAFLRQVGILVKKGKERTAVMEKFITLLQGKDGFEVPSRLRESSEES